MKTYARIDGDTVVEIVLPVVIEGEEITIDRRYHPNFVASLVVVPAGAAIAVGDSYVGGQFGPPPVTPTLPALVPAQVSMRQARLALLNAGKLAAVDAAIASLPSPGKEAALIEWNYSATVERGSAIVALLGPLLDLDDAALDAFFIEAASL